jgi:hypothetical protein
MKRSHWGSRVLGVAAAAAMLEDCGGSKGQPAWTAMTPMVRAPLSGPTQSRSWMLPGADAKRDLLYVSLQYDDIVVVYNYRTGDEVGILQGFNYPAGQCVDASGDVWVTNEGEYSVVEYAHGGKHPLRTLNTDNYPFGCSIDPTTGNLAVVTFNESSRVGDVDIFSKASGVPMSYSSSSCNDMSSPGYDNKGNLYLLARNSSTTVCELPHGGTALRTVSVDVTITAAVGVMWDGKHITLTDGNYQNTRTSVIYRAIESHSGNLKVVGSTQVTCYDRGNDLHAPFIVGKRNTPVNRQEGDAIVGADYFCSSDALEFWHYPVGGNPFKTIALDEAPNGQAVSISK